VQPGSSLLAWEARAAQQMWDVCEQTPECRREYLRPPARWPSCAGLRPLRLAATLPRFGERGGGSAHREKLFGRDAETCGMYRW